MTSWEENATSPETLGTAQSAEEMTTVLAAPPRMKELM